MTKSISALVAVFVALLMVVPSAAVFMPSESSAEADAPEAVGDGVSADVAAGEPEYVKDQKITGRLSEDVVVEKGHWASLYGDVTFDGGKVIVKEGAVLEYGLYNLTMTSQEESVVIKMEKGSYAAYSLTNAITLMMLKMFAGQDIDGIIGPSEVIAERDVTLKGGVGIHLGIDSLYAFVKGGTSMQGSSVAGFSTDEGDECRISITPDLDFLSNPARVNLQVDVDVPGITFKLGPDASDMYMKVTGQGSMLVSIALSGGPGGFAIVGSTVTGQILSSYEGRSIDGHIDIFSDLKTGSDSPSGSLHAEAVVDANERGEGGVFTADNMQMSLDLTPSSVGDNGIDLHMDTDTGSMITAFPGEHRELDGMSGYVDIVGTDAASVIKFIKAVISVAQVLPNADSNNDLYYSIILRGIHKDMDKGEFEKFVGSITQSAVNGNLVLGAPVKQLLKFPVRQVAEYSRGVADMLAGIKGDLRSNISVDKLVMTIFSEDMNITVENGRVDASKSSENNDLSFDLKVGSVTGYARNVSGLHGNFQSEMDATFDPEKNNAVNATVKGNMNGGFSYYQNGVGGRSLDMEKASTEITIDESSDTVSSKTDVDRLAARFGGTEYVARDAHAHSDGKASDIMSTMESSGYTIKAVEFDGDCNASGSVGRFGGGVSNIQIEGDEGGYGPYNIRLRINDGRSLDVECLDGKFVDLRMNGGNMFLSEFSDDPVVYETLSEQLSVLTEGHKLRAGGDGSVFVTDVLVVRDGGKVIGTVAADGYFADEAREVYLDLTEMRECALTARYGGDEVAYDMVAEPGYIFERVVPQEGFTYSDGKLEIDEGAYELVSTVEGDARVEYTMTVGDQSVPFRVGTEVFVAVDDRDGMVPLFAVNEHGSQFGSFDGNSMVTTIREPGDLALSVIYGTDVGTDLSRIPRLDAVRLTVTDEITGNYLLELGSGVGFRMHTENLSEGDQIGLSAQRSERDGHVMYLVDCSLPESVEVFVPVDGTFDDPVLMHIKENGTAEIAEAHLVVGMGDRQYMRTTVTGDYSYFYVEDGSNLKIEDIAPHHSDGGDFDIGVFIDAAIVLAIIAGSYLGIKYMRKYEKG